LAQSAAVRLMYEPVAFNGRGPSESLQAQFPHVAFDAMGNEWTSGSVQGSDVLIVYADVAAPGAVDRLCAGLRQTRTDRVIVFLSGADVETTRRILREGAADVLPTPVGDPALAVSLERVLSRLDTQTSAKPDRSGRVISFLKAG